MLGGNIKLYIGLFALLIIAGGGLLIKWQHSRIEELKTTTALLEKQNEAITKTANRFANKPKSDDDVTNELCRRAQAEYRRENPTVKRIPVRSCP